MFKSIRVGQAFGIPIYIHWSFLFLPLIVLFEGEDLDSSLWKIGLMLCLFVCVLLHELGHALSARRYGVETQDIILSVIGGVARLKNIPKKPVQELIVAAAGPAVNLVIAIILSIFLLLTGKMILPDGGIIGGDNFLFWVFAANILLAIFNLIPAFPMDGGRILRAILAMKIDRVKATKIAVYIGYLIAFVFAVFAIWSAAYTLLVISAFVVFSATTELRSIKNQAFMTDHKVTAAMRQQFTILQQSNAMDYAIQTLKGTGQKNFVVLNLMKVTGILTHYNIIKSIQERKTLVPIAEFMTANFVTVSSKDSIKTAYHLFIENNYELIPVVENGIVIGVLDKVGMNEFFEIAAAEKK